MSLATTYYATPNTFLDMLLELAGYIQTCRYDELMTKADVLDSMEKRASFLIGKMGSHPTCTSFAVFTPDPSMLTSPPVKQQA